MPKLFIFFIIIFHSALITTVASLTCIECSDECTDKVFGQSDNCSTNESCFYGYNYINGTVVQGCVKNGKSCESFLCVKCNDKDLCNNKADAIGKIIALSKQTSTTRQQPIPVSKKTIECYLCNGTECRNRSENTTISCFMRRSRQCYWGLTNGVPFSSCRFKGSCDFVDITNFCVSCTEDFCNLYQDNWTIASHTAAEFLCNECLNEDCLGGDETLDSCKSNSIRGCYSNSKNGSIQRGCGGTKLNSRTYTKCYRHLCNDVLDDDIARYEHELREIEKHEKEEQDKIELQEMRHEHEKELQDLAAANVAKKRAQELAKAHEMQKEQEAYRFLLASFVCYKCAGNECTTDDEKLPRCVTTVTCYIKVHNFVEERGCDFVCKNVSSPPRLGHEDPIDECTNCGERLCNTNQESNIDINEDKLELAQSKKRPIEYAKPNRMDNFQENEITMPTSGCALRRMEMCLILISAVLMWMWMN